MIEKVLAAANVPGKPAHFPDAPPVYAVWFDSVDTDGADCGTPFTIFHSCTVELYAPTVIKGNQALAAIGRELINKGIQYTTQGWYYLDDIKKYQEVIEFSYTNKN